MDQLPGVGLIAGDVAQAAAGRADAAEGYINQPGAEQVRSGIQPVRAEASQRRIAGLQQSTKPIPAAFLGAGDVIPWGLKDKACALGRW